MTQVSQNPGGGGSVTVDPGDMLLGPAPQSTSPLIVQGGSEVTAGGNYTLSFPVPFPNGLIAVMVCAGDQASLPGAVQLASSTTGHYTLSSCEVTWSGGAAFRFNWIAIGW